MIGWLCPVQLTGKKSVVHREDILKVNWSISNNTTSENFYKKCNQTLKVQITCNFVFLNVKSSNLKKKLEEDSWEVRRCMPHIQHRSRFFSHL